ncbi:MAG TPA: ABC transporter substrate-binding protein [Xanthobacteraceae bacterium]|nr:ABC transporter substrate-binding protein [Xanthobacteraceae bacterium]
MKNTKRFFAGAAIVALTVLPAGAAEINVGLTTSMTGPGASIGIPYAKGTAAGVAYKDEVDGTKLNLIQLDDATDPSTATRNARKLIEQDKVDVLIGSGSTPNSIAITAVCHELKVPCITLSPVNMPGEPGSWMISIPQPPNLMVSVVVDYMKKTGVKTVGYIGYSDGWGDLVYGGLEKSAPGDGIKVLTNERYARADTSVTAQALHIVSAAPDAVMTGGSGTPGALPFIALRERGYTKEIYGTPAIINPDFVRVGGSAVEGVIASTGPVVVADQLPDSYPTKKMSIAYEAAYQKANNEPARGAFGPYAFDGWLVLLDSAKRALATGAKPGTPEFRTALRDALMSAKEVVGTHGVYSFHTGDSFGVDKRALVLVKLVDGKWKLMQ